jgi:SAM-dependent methyltransferase
MAEPGDNREQIDYWNGAAAERWVQSQADIDRALGPFGREAIDRLAPREGERILDVGCGSGDTLLELARRVGDTGEIVGVDASRPLLERARARLQGTPRVQLLEADVSSHSWQPQFDALFSRFGVMFFSDPVAAFVNLRHALAPGGRLGFACWQSLDDNPWCALPLMAALPVLDPPPPAPPPPAPVPHAPGPFAFADPRHVRRVLAAAGYARIELSSHRAPVVLSEAGLDPAVDFALRVGPVARLVAERSDAIRDIIRQRLRSALASATTGRTVALDGAVWLVSARV